jgi:predicted nucleic acid-binding protein
VNQGSDNLSSKNNKKQKKNKHSATLMKIPKHSKLYISSVTLYELYMGATNLDKKNDIELLTKGIPILSLNKEVAIKSAEIFLQLKKLNHLVEFRDIFIAATSIVNQLELLTLNEKHFINIPEIKLYPTYPDYPC